MCTYSVVVVVILVLVVVVLWFIFFFAKKKLNSNILYVLMRGVMSSFVSYVLSIFLMTRFIDTAKRTYFSATVHVVRLLFFFILSFQRKDSKNAEQETKRTVLLHVE